MPVTVGRLTTRGIRHDTDHLFSKSGLMEQGNLPHTPFIALIEEPDGGITVTVVNSAEKASDLPPDTMLLIQWPGKWRSDFFVTTAEAVKDHLDRSES
jgi:hypothetical protein